MITIPEEFDPLAPYANPAAFGYHLYNKLPAAHHERWLRLALDPDIKRLLIIAPRESAKTTWIPQTLLPWWMGTHPLTTNFIGSISDDQAQRRLGAVQQIIENNPAWQDAFANIVPDKQRGWSADGLFIKDINYTYAEWMRLVATQGQIRDPNLFASGARGAGTIGSRITGLGIIDDPHDEKSSLTQLQRDRVWAWLMLTIDNTMSDEAKLIVITTRWHRDDVAGRIMEQSAGTWVIDETKAVVNGRSYWPGHWPMRRLNEKRRAIGSRYFRASYLNDPQGLAGDFFKTEDFLPLPMPLPEFKRVTVGVDLAISKKEQSDFRAVAVVGLDELLNCYLLYLERGKWSVDTTMKRVESIALLAEARWKRLDIVGIESNGFQAAAVQLILKDTLLPAMGIPASTDKPTRASPWQVRAEQGKFFADRDAPWWGTFIDEALDFPNGEHDDQIDAVSIAWAALSAKRGLTMV